MSDLRAIDRTRNFLLDELFDWAFGDNEDNLNEALLHELKIMPHIVALAPSQVPSTT